jgi:hypothetical protein
LYVAAAVAKQWQQFKLVWVSQPTVILVQAQNKLLKIGKLPTD